MNHCQCHHGDQAARDLCSRLKAEDRVRRLINAACAAHAGSAQMTLNDWQEVELEVKERIENEYARIGR
jgi:hypothetical protein